MMEDELFMHFPHLYFPSKKKSKDIKWNFQSQQGLIEFTFETRGSFVLIMELELPSIVHA